MKKRIAFFIVVVLVVCTSVPCFASLISWTNKARDEGYTHANTVFAMEVFNSNLYIGTSILGASTGCEVWRSTNGTDWTKVSTTGFGDANNEHIRSFAVFGSYLYAGVSNGNGCEVHRSSDGTTWAQVASGGFDDTNNEAVVSLIVYNSYLYAGTSNAVSGCEMWRSSDGTSWTQVNTDGFADANNIGVFSLALFDGGLYAGTYGVGPNRCEVWRTTNGIAWNQVNSDGFGDSDNYGVYSLAAFGNHIYAGTANQSLFWPGGQMWRSTDGTSWTQVNQDGFTDRNNIEIKTLHVFDQYLYAGTRNDTTGTEIHRTADGTNWYQVNADGFGSTSRLEVECMATFDNMLYVGDYAGLQACGIWQTDGIDWGLIPTVTEYGYILLALVLLGFLLVRRYRM